MILLFWLEAVYFMFIHHGYYKESLAVLLFFTTLLNEFIDAGNSIPDQLKLEHETRDLYMGRGSQSAHHWPEWRTISSPGSKNPWTEGRFSCLYTHTHILFAYCIQAFHGSVSSVYIFILLTVKHFSVTVYWLQMGVNTSKTSAGMVTFWHSWRKQEIHGKYCMKHFTERDHLETGV